MKFRVGDTVERINTAWCGMEIGEIDTITAISSKNSSVRLAINKAGHNVKNLKKIYKSLYKIY